MSDARELIRRTYERAAELAKRAGDDPDDEYARYWSEVLQAIGDAASHRQGDDHQ